MDTSRVDPKDCLDVIITDYQLHLQKVRKPNSLGRQIVKAFHGSKVRRAYSNEVAFDNKTKSATLGINLGTEELYALARKKGKKYVRFLMPKDGLNLYIGNDIIEKVESLKKRRLKNNAKSVYNK